MLKTKQMLSATLLVLAGLAGATASATDTLIIENAQLFSGCEAKQAQQRVFLVIKNGRIEGIHTGKPTCKSTRRIDATGKTVLPGLIDTHVHLFGSQNIPGRKGAQIQLKDDVPARLKAYLRHGVTTIKSVGDPTSLMIQLRNDITTRKLPGPRLLIAGPIFTAIGGHPAGTIQQNDQWIRSEASVEIKDEKHAHREVNKLAGKRVDAIKIAYNAFPWQGRQIPRLDRSLMKAVVNRSIKKGLKTTVHTWTPKEAEHAINAGAFGLEHGVVSAKLDAKFVAKLLKERRVSYTPTLAAINLFGGPLLKNAKHNLRLFASNGARIVLGSDTNGDLAAGTLTLNEVELMVESGLTPAQALSAATRNAAEHLGIADQVGTIERGKVADLVIVDGDPVKDISHIRRITHVVKAGRIIPLR